eukprot:COSAG02_NODE_10259_length_1983_cov_1.839788_3_plen_333_part_00
MPPFARSRTRLADVTSAFNCAAPLGQNAKSSNGGVQPETSPSALRVVDLREELKERQLPTTGRKAELIQRVRDARQAHCAAPARRRRQSRASPPASSPEGQPARTYTSELLAVEDPFKRSEKLPRTPLREGESPSDPSTQGADESATKPAASPPLTPENANGAATDVAGSTTNPASIARQVFNVVAILGVLVALTGGALVAQSDGSLAGTVEVMSQAVDQLDMIATRDEAVRAMNDAITTGSTAVQAIAGATKNMTTLASDTLTPYGQQLSTDVASTIASFSEQCNAALAMVAGQWQGLVAGLKLQTTAGMRVAELEAQVAELEAELQSGRR